MPAFPSSAISSQLCTIVGQSVDSWFNGKINPISYYLCTYVSIMQFKNTHRNRKKKKMKQKIVTLTFLACGIVLKEAKKKKKKKKASSKRWGVFDAGRITGPNKL